MILALDDLLVLHLDFIPYALILLGAHKPRFLVSLVLQRNVSNFPKFGSSENCRFFNLRSLNFQIKKQLAIPKGQQPKFWLHKCRILSPVTGQ